MSDILSMVALRDRIKQILMEPTLDKAFNGFASIMLVTFLVTIVSPLIGGQIQYELLIVQGVACILSAIAGLLFKKFDQDARDKASDRLKAEINHQYLLENPKLKDTEIFLDQLEVYNDQLRVLTQLVESALNIKIKENGEKYNDPATSADASTPWQTDTVIMATEKDKEP